MIFGSVCSGIEAASVAWHPLGWRAAFLSEIEPFPCAVLAERWPGVPNLGDMTKFKGWPDAAIDLLVGGTPCQSFSVAGLRKGLRDPRGNLMLTYLAIAARYRPRWLVWENVPGVLSSNEGRDFAALLSGMAELGYGFAYRIFDAQYFGLAQRRARVFVVASARGWRSAAAVLFERASLRGDSAPSREAGENSARPITPGSRCGSGYRNDADTADNLIAHALRADGFDASEDGTGRGTPLIPVATGFNARQDPDAWLERAGPLDTDGGTQAVAFSCKDHGADAGELAPTLRAMGHSESHANAGGQLAFAFAQNQRDEVRMMDVAGALAAEPEAKQQTYTLAIRGRGEGHDLEFRSDGVANALLTPNGGRAGIGVGAVSHASQVRRLTPKECERLQGFPDDYTLIDYRGKPAKDGPRYKALGNSMAVPVMRWIGERIEFVEAIAREAEAT